MIRLNASRNLAARPCAGDFLALILLTNLLVTSAPAQTFTTLHRFQFTNGTPDGDNPYGGLIISGNTLYGTASGRGLGGAGTVFAVNTDGSGFTVPKYFLGGDGATPFGGLVLSGGTLYGTTRDGGSGNQGTVFKVNLDGSGFTNLHSFNFADGYQPFAGLVLSGNTLYGTTEQGGSSGNGTVFKVNTDSSGFSNFYNFSVLVSATNSDGANPDASLILSGSTLYGTTTGGGTNGNGTIFRINLSGTGFTNIYSFHGYSDGSQPEAALTLSGSTLYGTASHGGTGGSGTVFKVNTDGTGFTNLYDFTALSGSNPNFYNSDGANPFSSLILSGNSLYGTAATGGTNSFGTVFAVSTNGTSFTTLYSFTGGSDGITPYAGLTLSGSTLYGTTFYGGDPGYGTAFSLTLPPPLNIISAATNVVLKWPTNASGFVLEYASNLVSPVVWNTNSTAPVVISGQNTLTNPAFAPARFYRLAATIPTALTIAVTGYNRDVVVERTATGIDTTPYAAAFDAVYGYGFYEAGLNAVTVAGGNPTTEGLPQGGAFMSVPDGKTPFQLGPYNGNNVLYMNSGSPSATLALASPATYNSLIVLATSANGGGSGSFVINFVDHTSSSPISFNAPDWFFNPGGALTHFGRIYLGAFGAFQTDDPSDNNPNLYPTNINLAALGLNTKPIASLTFTMPNGAGTSSDTATGIFALSGIPAQ